MDLKEIVSIAGVSGLHKIIGRSKNGLILETMSEPKKRFATGMHDKVSVLEDISMYTEEGDVQLAEVLVKLNEQEKAGNAAPTSKDESKVQRAFVNTAVKLDNDRVYDSDIKKLITWFNLLKGKLDFVKLSGEEAAEETEETKAEAKPKKAAAKKAKTADAEEAGADAKEEKPKKVAAKKAAAPKAPKTAAPKKDVNTKVSSKGAGNKNTYRPKSV